MGSIRDNKVILIYYSSNTDMYLKREEFLMWLSDVKMLNVETITP